MNRRSLTVGALLPGRRPAPVAVLAAVLASLLTFNPYPYDHVVSRWALVRSVVDDGTTVIDRYSAFTSDRAVWEGHSYSDKSALLSLACVPPALVLESLGIGRAHTIPLGLFDPARYVCERLLVSGSLLLLLLLLARRTSREGIDPLPAVAAAGLGSIMLPYSTVLYSHVPAAAMLFAGYSLQQEGRFRASDACCALASAMDYTVLLLYTVLVLFRPRSWWKPSGILAAVLMTAAAFAPQMAYNSTCFGSPFRMGYALEASEAFAALHTGFFGFTAPDAGRFLFLLASPERGLLFYMPWIAAGIAGLVSRTGAGRIRIDPGLVMTAVYVVLYSALHTRTQGWAFGPRYLIPVIPFAALGLSRFAERGSRARWAAAFLLIPGVIQTFLGLLGEMHLPVHPVEQAVPLPQVTISLRMLLDGHHSTWIADLPGVVLLVAATTLVVATLFRGSRFAPAALLSIPMLLSPALSSRSASQGWGGKMDYYRGVLAEHRMEYALAAGYFTKAAQDPAAPALVGELAEEMRILSGSPAGPE
ncbi:MAG: hypothetical protein QUS11_01635 [Candidatus Fermentibacter sp.]|nr:hypothetical protein [Candidatus Fermentibacter sp.]